MELFREDYKTVLSVRPGITDYAAIEYRNEEEVLGKLGKSRIRNRESEMGKRGGAIPACTPLMWQWCFPPRFCFIRNT